VEEDCAAGRRLKAWRELVAKDVNEGTMSIRKIAAKWKISPARVFQLGQQFKDAA
jgi:transposase